MRPRVAIPLVLVSGLLVILMLLIRSAPTEKPGPSTPLTGESPGSDPIGSARPDTGGMISHHALHDQEAGSPAVQTPPDEYVTGRVAELLDLAMTDDPASLSAILAELNNPHAEIREAAVVAAVEFKSTEAVPALMDAYNRTAEPEEKLSLRKAIDFLKTGQ
jgi:hypothetical protein